MPVVYVVGKPVGEKMMSVVVLEGIMSSRELLTAPEAYDALLEAYQELNSRPLYLYKEVVLRKRIFEYLRMRNQNFKE